MYKFNAAGYATYYTKLKPQRTNFNPSFSANILINP